MRTVNRAAMLATIFVVGGLGGWILARSGAPAPAPAAPLVASAPSGPAGEEPLQERYLGGDYAPPPPAAEPEPASSSPATPLGAVPLGPPAAGDSTHSTPIPTRAQLEALRAELAVPVAGVARAELHDTFHESRAGGERVHQALDILAPRGTDVLSAADGRLLKLFTSEAGGLMVYASDATGRFILLYGHLDGYADGLREGMELRRGQRLGVVGTTGNAPADVPHLHFGIMSTDDASAWWRGTPVDPYPLLKP